MSTAAQIATLLGVPLALAGVVLAALALRSGDDAPEPSATRPAASATPSEPTPNPTPSPTPSPEPTETLEALWIRSQGRLCREFNQRAASNPRPPSDDPVDQLPTLRGALDIVGRFVADSAELRAPESIRSQVEVMLGHWSDGHVYLLGMIRAAEQGDDASFNQRVERFQSSMDRGHELARELGARQCV